MPSSLALPYVRHERVGHRRLRRRTAPAPRPAPPPPRLIRYLPLAVLTTSLVIVAPALLARTIVPAGGWAMTVLALIAAVLASLVLASAAAAVWKRRVQSRDVVFGDLMLWGLLRRCWTERRLSQARELFDTAHKVGPAVGVEQLTGLSRLLEARDSYTHGHGQRVARHAGRIAHAMHLPPADVARIRAAAAVHDVGKLYTPRHILNNPARLSDEEFAVVKRHPVDGAEMLTGVGDPQIAAMVRHHHERVEGGGYPAGLVGEAIPLGARIIAVADTFDAITSARAYRPAATQKQALDILRTESGRQLDAEVVAIFRRHCSARRSVAWFALAAAIPQRILAALQSASLGTGAAGVASIAPALGAAGLLTLTPAFQAGKLAHRSVSAQPAFTFPAPTILPVAAPTVRPRLRPAPTTSSTKSPGRTHGASGRTGNGSPLSALSPGTSAPTVPTRTGEGSPHAPAAPERPTSAPPATPAPAPPTVGVPQLPVPPVAPPVSVPPVNVPAPQIPLPSTPVPVLPHAIETPSVSVPGVG
jgi:HD-GYP domain-containing protein (c-di-GMP phosphodiesterase class II)